MLRPPTCASRKYNLIGGARLDLLYMRQVADCKLSFVRIVTDAHTLYTCLYTRSDYIEASNIAFSTQYARSDIAIWLVSEQHFYFGVSQISR